jgi:DNA-directed RNA polymerase subunit RPC12/RpoP
METGPTPAFPPAGPRLVLLQTPTIRAVTAPGRAGRVPERTSRARVPTSRCVRCSKRIPAYTGYVREDGGPAHVRCPGVPDSLLEALRCPACGKPAWKTGYLVLEGRPWHLGCVPGTVDRASRNGSAAARRVPGPRNRRQA